MNAKLPPVTLVLGGARSGKSAHAERLVEDAGGGTYLATAEARDDEMMERIRLHRERRGGLWQSVEEPLDLVGALRSCDGEGHAAVLVDCLTIWLSNLIMAGRDAEAGIAALVDALPGLRVPVVFVSNELGLGIVPENALAREFRDMHGLMNQVVAAAASRVVFVAAGLPLTLKEETA